MRAVSLRRQGSQAYTTVELIEEEVFWAPPTALVWFRIGPDEVDLQAKARRGGAVWHRDRRLWLMPYRLARAMNMPSRIVLDPPPAHLQTFLKKETFS